MKILKIHSLEKGWCDKDRVLLHACFQLLVDYVEMEEALSGHIDWSWDEEHKRTAKEIRSLYRWWTKTRPNRKDPVLELPRKYWPADDEWFVDATDQDGRECRMMADLSKKYPEYYAAMRRGWKLEDKWFDEDQKNLHRLIEIRRHLWT